ncbi:MAG: hypothetical protein AAFP16_14255 [Pseudomonadota bacterium]
MRTLMFAAGICLAAASAAQALTFETVTRTDSTVTFANGCAYTANAYGQDNMWTFAYATTGAGTHCPLLLRERAAATIASPEYLVGVYR